MTEAALKNVRALCLGLPEVTERLSHGSPTWFIGGRPSFVTFVDDHHGDGRMGFWCAAPPGAQEAFVSTDPERFFVPPYVGHRGWLGVRLEGDPDWSEVEEIITDAFRSVAPRRLLAGLSDQA